MYKAKENQTGKGFKNFFSRDERRNGKQEYTINDEEFMLLPDIFRFFVSPF